MAHQVRRSWLLVPASDENLVQQAHASSADVVVLDLVELVPEAAKPSARPRVREAIGAAARGGAEVFAQVDRELLYADLKASVWPGLAGVVVARSESPQDVADTANILGEMEQARGILPGSVQIVASLETAKGNYGAAEIARASGRVWGITLGRADLVMDLRPETSGEIHLMLYLMQRLITVANATGVVPLGAWWKAPARGLLAGPEETYEAALRGRKIGFKGSLCLSPYQVEPMNRGFTPAAAEVDEASQLIEAYTRADADSTTSPHMGDRIIDLPSIKQARELLALASACAARDQAKAKAVAGTG